MSYLGAKNGTGVFHNIIALMPPHETYCEPFVGSGAILARKTPAFQSIVLDLDPAMAHVHADRRGVTAICGCGLEFLAALAAELRDPVKRRRYGRIVVYADPPYVATTRTSSKRYKHEFTDADHRRLAEVLDELAALGVAVILSGYPSALYDELFAGWRTREFQTMTRGGARTEKVWFNFEPSAAHCVTFAGRNYIDRQRIKRKAARWRGKFEKLPGAERQAVLAALMEVGDRPQSETSVSAEPGGGAIVGSV